MWCNCVISANISRSLGMGECMMKVWSLHIGCREGVRNVSDEHGGTRRKCSSSGEELALLSHRKSYQRAMRSGCLSEQVSQSHSSYP